MRTNTYRGWALGTLVVCALAAVPKAPAGAAAPATANVSAEASASAPEAPVPSVLNPSGTASELLGKLTIPQLASLLNVTPEQLTASIERQAIAPLVGAATETAAQLRGVVGSALTDIGDDGGIAQLAQELGLPRAAVEAAQFTSATAEGAAGMLGTSVEGLDTALTRAGAIASRTAPASRVAVAPVGRTASTGTTLIVGTPTGSGGVTLTTVNSTPSSVAAGFKSSSPARVSNAFSILSVRVTKTGAILETVRLPGPGRVSVVASAAKPSASRSTSRHARLRTRTVKVAFAAKKTSGGTLTITLRPRGVSSASRVRVTLATTYAPTGGSPRTLKRVVTISRRGSRRHR
jgi:hypothetical protein